MPRTYVDNPMNRNLGRVGMPVGSAVHSPSSSSSGCGRADTPKRYVDNPMNQQLGRVGMEYGTAVHSKADTPKRYVDNPMNQQLGRVGMEYGTAVHSKADTPKRYVDNPMNQQLGRVGMEYGTAVHSKADTPKRYVDNPMNQQLGRVGMEYGTAVHSKADTPKRNVHIPLNRQLGRLEMECGTAVQSKADTPKRYVDNPMNQQLGRVGMEYGTAVHSKSQTKKTYVDNPVNRRLGRVGMPYGTAVASRNLLNQLLLSEHKMVNKKTEVSKCRDNNDHTTEAKSNITQEKKLYVDNAFNRKLKRVGLPLGSVPVSRKNEVYRDTPVNRGLGRVGKPWGTHVRGQKKLAALCNHLDEHLNEEIPAELDDLSEDAVSSVLEFRQREEAVNKFHEENANTTWKPHEHTLTETIKGYQGKVIDFAKLELKALIGHGGFGDVYFASLDGEAVAVKRLKCQQVTKKCLQQFMNEMDVFVALNHPNIVTFIGACTQVPNLSIVMEFMDMSLFDAIHIKGVDFCENDKLEILRGATAGMAYLHCQDIAHCDLKTQNVLLINVPGLSYTDESQRVRAKITDFGLSKMRSDMATSSSVPPAQIGTPKYAAPELHRGEILTLDELTKADIFSLGLLIWELAEEDIPFEGLNTQQLKVQVGEKGLTPVIPNNLRLDGNLHKSLSACWSMNPMKRPSSKSMAELAGSLTTIFEKGEE